MKRFFFAVFSICLLLSAAKAQDTLSVANDAAVLQQTTLPTTIEYTKTDGDSAYINTDYAMAIQIYEALLQKGEAADLYYNLGNGYYKSGDIARAILNYERALLLKPGNEDIRANLEIARSKTVDKIVTVPEIFFVSWIKTLINTQSTDNWAKWGVALFLLFIVGLYFFIFSKRSKLKKVGFFTALVLLLFVVCINSFASYQKRNLINRSSAIVVSPSVTVRSTPNESGTSLFVIHEGCKVSIKDNSMKNWKEISLEDGKVGWIETSNLEII